MHRSARWRRGTYCVLHTYPKSWHRRHFQNCKKDSFPATWFPSLLHSYSLTGFLLCRHWEWGMSKGNRMRRMPTGRYMLGTPLESHRDSTGPCRLMKRFSLLRGELRKMKRLGVSFHITKCIWLERLSFILLLCAPSFYGIKIHIFWWNNRERRLLLLFKMSLCSKLKIGNLMPISDFLKMSQTYKHPASGNTCCTKTRNLLEVFCVHFNIFTWKFVIYPLWNHLNTKTK